MKIRGYLTMENMLQVGVISSTHGIRGEVRIVPWADDALFLKRFKTFYIDNKPVRVLSSRVHKDMLIAQLEGINADKDATIADKDATIADKNATIASQNTEMTKMQAIINELKAQLEQK